MFKYIETEVAGGFGEATTLDISMPPPIVFTLEHSFDGWLGDCIMETFPCFVITEKAKVLIENLNLSGIFFDSVITSKSDIFEELYPNIKLPEIYWTKITGIVGKDDFGIADDLRLVISDDALKVLESCGLKHAGITDYYHDMNLHRTDYLERH
ncbi:hypothetical protein ACE2KI_000132 [Salmonella enterica]|nr:hypothetical protein [Salmonella enterica subsp. enterica serovar Kintambo]EIW7618925.1 hypothetical protein [Salmonella enterica subsp. enterica serovar Kintambo]EJA0782430.1 hypothetical protein [Salmonella enterica]EKH9928405.1 hypothetical protein [Salmonella enterica subsp. enterica]